MLLHREGGHFVFYGPEDEDKGLWIQDQAECSECDQSFVVQFPVMLDSQTLYCPWCKTFSAKADKIPEEDWIVL